MSWRRAHPPPAERGRGITWGWTGDKYRIDSRGKVSATENYRVLSLAPCILCRLKEHYTVFLKLSQTHSFFNKFHLQHYIIWSKVLSWNAATNLFYWFIVTRRAYQQCLENNFHFSSVLSSLLPPWAGISPLSWAFHSIKGIHNRI